MAGPSFPQRDLKQEMHGFFSERTSYPRSTLRFWLSVERLYSRQGL